MIVFQDPSEIREYILAQRDLGKTIGFVPTMGALHAGHQSLIRKAKSENDFVVVSIFVNPRQFDDADDLASYPQTPQSDIEASAKAGADLLLMPTRETIFPANYAPESFELGPTAEVLEGAARPGHYLGVAQVISKLVNFTWPHTLYLGQKDYQQFLIISIAIQQILGPKPKVLMVPTMRERDGLAMSSRNIRLAKNDREVSTLIYRTLQEAEQSVQKLTPNELSKWVETSLEDIEGMSVDYALVADMASLKPLEDWANPNGAILLVAVRFGGIRLIDNVVLISPSEAEA